MTYIVAAMRMEVAILLQVFVNYGFESGYVCFLIEGNLVRCYIVDVLNSTVDEFVPL